MRGGVVLLLTELIDNSSSCLKIASTELADSQKIWAVWRRDAEGALRSAFFQACSIEPIA